MALIKCPECGHQVSDKAYSCPNCGYPLNDLVDNEIVSREQPINQEEQPPINNKYEISEQWQEYVERINGKSIFERTLSKLKRTISSKIETWKSTHNNSSSLAKIDQKDEYKISKQWQEYVQEQNCENSFHRNLIHHKRNLKRHFRNYYANHKSTIITVLVVFIAMCVVVAFAIWLAVSGTTSKKSNTPTTVTSNQPITQDTKSKQKKIDTIRIKISCKNPLEFDFPLSLSQMRKIEMEWDRQSYSMYDWSVWGSIVLYYCIDFLYSLSILQNIHRT